MGDPICKWRAARPHNVVELVNDILPHEEMPENDFYDIVDKRMPGFMHTPYQLAAQLGLYAVVDGTYYPRFKIDIDDEEATRYLENVVTKYYVPNPYTKRGFTNLDKPILLEKSIVEYLEKYPSQNDLEQILKHLIREDVGNYTAIKTLLSYSKLFTISGNTITLNPNYKEMEIDVERNNKRAFFEIFSAQLKRNKINGPLQQIYYGAPGTGKSFAIDSFTNDDNSIRTTFHPDTDYASFVGAYKPTMKSVKMSAFVGKEVQFAQPQQGHPGTEQRIVYKYVPQAFLKAYVAAWSNLDTPYYLIIEEINRGNCAQIFGDLFQLLDRNNAGSSSYAINADEDITKFLKEDVNGFASLSQKQRDAIAAYELVKDNGEKRAIGGKILDGTLLLLPHNLHIWATMNTSDQSLFPIDSAFKRRWNWKYVPIDTNPLDKRTQQPLNWKFEVAGNLYSWGKFLEIINPEIYSITESSDKQMGYFFAKADPVTGIISEEVFLNKVLFYLWTDVFKDYDVSSEIFKNKKENRSFRFTDFFEDAEALANFIENCGLETVEVDINSIEDEDSTDDSTTVNNLGRDYSKYSINGIGKYNKRQAVLQSLRQYVEENKDLTPSQIIDNWNSINPRIPYFILSATDYEARVSEMPREEDRYWSVAIGNGEKVYITNQWNINRISDFISLVNSSELGIHIEKLS